jgi:phosphohistidine swiveling domain-containing protein
MIQPPFDRKKELFIWGPTPLKNYYAGGMNRVLYEGCEFRKYPKYEWPLTLLIFKDRKACWINSFEDLWGVGGKAFLEVMCVPKKRCKLLADFNKCHKVLERVEKKIDRTSLSKLSDEEFISLWDSFHEAVRGFWIDGLLPELANYGGEKVLKTELSKELQDESDLMQVMQVLTAPEEISFYQEEELALFKTKNVKLHAKKFYWLKNSYFGTVDLSQDFFEERKKNLPKNLLVQMKQHLMEAKQKKNEVQKKHKLSKRIMDLAQVLSKGIEFQDMRKGLIFKYIGYAEKLLTEYSRRRTLDKDLLANLDSLELSLHFKGKKDYSSEIQSRQNGFTQLLSRNLKFLSSDETSALWDYYLSRESSGQKEVRGIVVSKGLNPVVQGKARILLDPHKIDSIQGGEVLIAPMTSPEYVFAMKKSIAIVTDTGGLTSHAAIVSRELKKPCIVGTKVATKIFQDGDLVEVDANKGIVRKIK